MKQLALQFDEPVTTDLEAYWRHTQYRATCGCMGIRWNYHAGRWWMWRSYWHHNDGIIEMHEPFHCRECHFELRPDGRSIPPPWWPQTAHDVYHPKPRPAGLRGTACACRPWPWMLDTRNTWGRWIRWIPEQGRWADTGGGRCTLCNWKLLGYAQGPIYDDEA